jgi:hypothetical protein
VGDGRDDLHAAGGQGVATLDRPQGQDDPFEVAAVVAAVPAGHRNPDGLAVAGRHVDLLLRDAPHPGEERGPGPAVAPDELAVAGAGLEHLIGRGPEQILGWTGEQLGGGVVDGGDRPVGVENDDGVGQKVEELGRVGRAGTHWATTPARWRRAS